MRRRKRPTKRGDLVELTIVAVGLFYLLGAWSMLSKVVIGIALVMLWASFLMPTNCDYTTQRGKPCDRKVRGKLRGCRDHARWKRDAIFRTVRLANPGARLRVMWSAKGASPPGSPMAPNVAASGGRPAPNPTPPSRKNSMEAAMLVFTVVSAIAGVIALFK